MSFKLRWALAVACADVFSFDFSNWVDDLQEKAAASDRFLKWVGILQLGLLALDIWLLPVAGAPRTGGGGGPIGAPAGGGVAVGAVASEEVLESLRRLAALGVLTAPDLVKLIGGPSPAIEAPPRPMQTGGGTGPHGPLEGADNHKVFDAAGNLITDIDLIENDVLWEKKSAENAGDIKSGSPRTSPGKSRNTSGHVPPARPFPPTTGTPRAASSSRAPQKRSYGTPSWTRSSAFSSFTQTRSSGTSTSRAGADRNRVKQQRAQPLRARPRKVQARRRPLATTHSYQYGGGAADWSCVKGATFRRSWGSARSTVVRISWGERSRCSLLETLRALRSMLAMSRHLTLAEAALAIGVSVDTLRRWERSDRLQTERDVRNHHLVSELRSRALAVAPCAIGPALLILVGIA